VDAVSEYFPDDSVVLGIVPEGYGELRDEVMRYVVKKAEDP